MYRYHAELIRVVDGDTVDLRIDLGFRIFTDIRCRLAGINAPEKRGPTKPAGYAAQTRLEELISLSAGQLAIDTKKTGKYGRWLAVLYAGTLNLNLRMVEDGHAVPYGESPW